MTKKWINRGELNNGQVIADAKAYKITPEFAAILYKRGLDYNDLVSPSPSVAPSGLLKDMEKGVDIVYEGIKAGRKFCVVNDYDVDGITSGTIMDEAIRISGGESFILTPSRVIDGYGISKRIVEVAVLRGAEIIVTTDNGIAATEAISFAKEQGITVVITDHHEVPKAEDGCDFLPPADAIIDPKQQECNYPFKDICGAEVALKFAVLLLAKANVEKTVSSKSLRRFTEMAAIGTVCDVMPLVKENRALVKAGLELLSKSQIVGLRQLMKQKAIDTDNLSAYSIGFGIGPCINSMSRMNDDTETPLKLLSEKDYLKADSIAKAMVKVNDNRQKDQEYAKEEALRILNESGSNNIDIIYIENGNPALMGIVAGKIKDITGHPTVCVTDDAEGILKGSGRSTDNYNMFEMFSLHKNLYEKFGGHAGAIGISFKKDNLRDIVKLLNEDAKDYTFVPEIIVDLFLPMSDVKESFVKELELLEPIGHGNPEVVLCDDHSLLTGLSYIGKDKQYLKLCFDNNGKTTEAVYFGDNKTFLDYLTSTFGETPVEELFQTPCTTRVPLSILYSPSINVWNGNTSISFKISDYQIRT